MLLSPASRLISFESWIWSQVFWSCVKLNPLGSYVRTQEPWVFLNIIICIINDIIFLIIQDIHIKNIIIYVLNIIIFIIIQTIHIKNMIICVLNIMIFIIINIKNTVIFIIKNIHLGSADPLGIGDPCEWVCRPCREEK